MITLPHKPTRLNVSHEIAHMLDFQKYRDDYYKPLTPTQNDKIMFEKLNTSRTWDQLNDLEREWPLNYPSTRQ